MNALQQQERKLLEAEVNRINELFEDYSNKEKEFYIGAYNDGANFVIESDKSLEKGVDLSNFLAFSD